MSCRDTVSSVGFIPKRLPFTTSNTHVRTFRHAVSLDEHRAKFKANLWNRPTADEANLGTHSEDESEEIFRSLFPIHMGHHHSISTSTNSTYEDRKLDNLEEKHLEKEEIHSKERTTDVEEVWFAVRPFFLFSISRLRFFALGIPYRFVSLFSCPRS